jgi:hypothetical protein
MVRRRVLVFEAGVAATALLMRRKSSSGGAASDSNRDGIPRSVTIVLLPAGCAERTTEIVGL